MIDDDFTAAAARLQAYILEYIPLTQAMDLTVTRYTGNEIEMSAPLTPNVNDKGCAFGGSMASLLTLAGWGLVELGLRARELECDIFVGDSRVRYHEPVWGKLQGVARFSAEDALEALATSLRARGKGHTDVVCEIAGAKRAAATLTARFFAKLRTQ